MLEWVKISCTTTVTTSTHRLEELLEPLVSGVLGAGDDDVGDVGGARDEQLVVLGLAAVLAHRHEPHVLEDVHHQLPDALLVVHPETDYVEIRV